MNLSLDVGLKIKVTEGDKTKETLKIFLREKTKAEAVEAKKIVKRFNDLMKKAAKLSRRNASLMKKEEFSEQLNKPEKALYYREERDKLEDEIEVLGEETEELGGEDFAENAAKENFELLVSGPGKEKLAELAESQGYGSIMKKLFAEKAEVEKKQFGE